MIKQLAFFAGAAALITAAVHAGKYMNGPEKKPKFRALMDLHLHLDGSLSISSVKELAKMQNIELPNDSELKKKLTVSPNCHDLNEYLEKFEYPLSLLQTREALSVAVYNLCEELKEQGLIYAEIRFAPLLHTQKGLSIHDAVSACIDGLNQSDFKAGLILCCMRSDSEHENNENTIRTAKEFLGKGVYAIDLAGAEGLYPTRDFEDLFELANELGVPFTIHAGEAAGPESVMTALKFGAKRIGHGVASANSPKLMKKLAEKGVTLELCPSSNIQTKIFSNLSEFPLRKLINAGVRVTINTDNMTVSHTTLENEFELLDSEFLLSENEIKKLLLNSVSACFASEKTKKLLRKIIISEYK